MHLRIFSAAAAVLASSLSAYGATLAGTTAGTAVNGAAYYGQSFTVAGSGAFNDITINFYKANLTPFAAGTGYLFTSSYNGTVSGLSSASANLVGEAVASGNEWTFSPSVVLAAGTLYYFYEDGVNPASTTLGYAPYPTGGNEYYANTASNSFVMETGRAKDFLVTGTPVAPIAATPEPSSLALLGTGVLCMIGAVRRRFAV